MSSVVSLTMRSVVSRWSGVRGPAVHTYSVGMTASPRESCVADSGRSARAAACRSAPTSSGFAGHDLAALDQLHLELPVRQLRRDRSRADHLGLRDCRTRPAAAPPTCGRRRTSCRPSTSSPPAAAEPPGPRTPHGRRACRPSSTSGARCRSPAGCPRRTRPRAPPPARRWRTRPGREVTTILVPVAPSSSSCCRTRCATSSRSPESMRTAPSSGPGDLDGRTDGLGDVVRVHQQRRAPPERVHLRRGRRPARVSCSRVKAWALVPTVGMS